MQQFTIGEPPQTFSIVRKLDAFKQLDVAMRLAPILAELIPVVKRARTDDAGLLEALPSIVAAAGKLTDESRRVIIMNCLECVQYKMDGDKGWANVAAGGNLMRQDMQLPMMLMLTWKVLEANLVDFSSALAGLGLQLPAQE
jgi:hypothetical protein